MILVIDNYDSFVHNLARYMALAGWAYEVVRNDAISIDNIRTINPAALVLSPGPCTPKEAGICIEAIQKLGPTTPILGVCLGHQCIGEAFGATTKRAQAPVHGKNTLITHNGEGLFANLPSPLKVGRYHSLIVEPAAHSPLIISAYGPDKQIMALHHKKHPIYGVQFHPESVLTDRGMDIVKNFKTLVDNWHTNKTQGQNP